MGRLSCSTHSIDELVEEIRTLLNEKTLQPRTILCVNAHIYNLAWADPQLRRRLNDARVCAADGMGIVMAARFAGAQIAERCNMTEAFRAFLQAPGMPESRAVLLGIGSDEVQRAADAIEGTSTHCRVVEALSGYHDDVDYKRILAKHLDADLVLVGMGTPKTERVCSLAEKICPAAVVWGIGGGTLRIFAGAMREAPPLMRRAGLQWLHRLCTEPAAMWRRYLLGNPLFIARVLASTRRNKNQR